MPYKPELTWISHARRWRKRYLGNTYYLKTKVGGKSDRDGYLAALAEWERVKAYVDGLGPTPYTSTGVLIPAEKCDQSDESGRVQPIGGLAVAPVLELPSVDDPAWILSRGIAPSLHPQLIVKAETPIPYSDERRVSALVTTYLDHRRREAERGNLSLSQYDEDKRQVETFRDFLNVNYPTLAHIDQLTPAMLNLYRDKQTEISASNITLKKRLLGVRKWLNWLIDQNILTELPKDLSSYAKVKMDRPKPTFFSIEELRFIHSKADPLLQACFFLGLNAGFTQQDCSTLTPDMIDLKTGNLSRDRSKTGVVQRSKLWPETLDSLRAVGRFDGGLLLTTPSGKPLVSETVNPANGKVVKVDHVRHRWLKLDVDFAGKSFKHLRKTAADKIEQWNPALTPLFLAHADSRGVRRHYVGRHGYDELFVLTDRLRDILSPAWSAVLR